MPFPVPALPLLRLAVARAAGRFALWAVPSADASPLRPSTAPCAALYFSDDLDLVDVDGHQRPQADVLGRNKFPSIPLNA